jgi:tripartite-type tricarboxylate transporter receptor subunit TctC
VADFVGRTVGEKLSAKWGQPVVVENKAGAGTNIGSDFVAKSNPDGYTLLLGSSNNTVNMSLFKKMPYDVVKDFEPVTLIVQVPNILVVNPSVKANSAKDIITMAKADPGKLSYASAGNGSPAHLATELFKKMAGIDILAITYKGAGPAVIDLMGGQVDMMFTNIPATLQNIRANKLKALGVTSAKRNQTLPLVPTIAESGLPGYEFSAWYGMLAPAGTPKDIIEKINIDIVSILKNPEVVAKLNGQGTEVVGGDSEALKAVIKSDLVKYSKLISEIGLTPE